MQAERRAEISESSHSTSFEKSETKLRERSSPVIAIDAEWIGILRSVQIKLMNP